MEKFEVVCQECESEYEIRSMEGTQPEYCPYCGEYNLFEDEELQADEDEEEDL